MPPKRRPKKSANGESRVLKQLDPRICNYVCTAHLVCVSDRSVKSVNITVATMLTAGRCNPRVFPCCTIRAVLPPPPGMKAGKTMNGRHRVTLELFKTGKIVASGAQHPIEALTAMTQVAALLSEWTNYVQVYLPVNFRVQNAVMHGAFGHALDLQKFWKKHAIVVGDSTATASLEEKAPPRQRRGKKPKRPWITCDWLKQSFPGLRVFMPNGCPVIIAFSTGAWIATGSPRLGELISAVQQFDWANYKPAVT